jgi:hypothetical protein
MFFIFQVERGKHDSTFQFLILTCGKTGEKLQLLGAQETTVLLAPLSDAM